MLHRSAITLIAALCLSLCACSADGSPDSPASKASSAEGTTDEAVVLNIYAAASLTETFAELEAIYESDYPNVDVRLNLAGSQDLVAQLSEGAAGDVLATANTKSMKDASDKGLVGDSTVFATNTLTLITAPGNPHNITGLDSSLDGIKLVICAPEVPCGALTEQLTTELGITLAPVSEEQAVTDVRGKVSSGEADAGIVYRTDAIAEGGSVTEVAIAGADRAVNTYPIAVVSTSKHPKEAEAWIALVMSDEGQKILADAGFSAAPPHK